MSPWLGGASLLAGGLAFFALTWAFRWWALSIERRAWRGREILEIVGIETVSHNVKVFSLRRLHGRPWPPVRAGQFLTFQISEHPLEVRSYSLCSSAVQPEVWQVAVKLVPGGLGSAWFHNRQVGDRVPAYAPGGHFTDYGLENQSKVYIAGGIGITPILSMIRTNLQEGASGEIRLFYGFRSMQDRVFHDELMALSRQHANFHYYPVSTEPAPEWTGLVGWITEELLHRHGAIDSSAHYFVCGPSVMMETLVGEILRAGVPSERVHTERFVSRASLDISRIPERRARVTLGGQVFDYQGRQTLLEFAESHGIKIPYSCRTGVCGTCQCRAVGPVTMLTDAGLSVPEKAEGIILACVAFPEGDLQIDPIS